MVDIWKDINGFEGIYQVNQNGEIRSLPRSGSGARHFYLPMKCYNNGKNYRYVTLRKNNKPFNKYVHRLVADAFLPKDETRPDINHINGIKSDNRLENLERCTKSENMIHARNTNLLKVSNSKIDEADVLLIRGVEGKMSRKDMCQLFGLSPASISRIVNNKQW